MTNQHPITPPPELVKKWVNEALNLFSDDKYLQLRAVGDARGPHIAALAARWGADQELEACCEWASQFNYDDYRYQDELRALRRPKPPSLKEKLKEAIYNENLGEALRLAEQLDDSL